MSWNPYPVDYWQGKECSVLKVTTQFKTMHWVVGGGWRERRGAEEYVLGGEERRKAKKGGKKGKWKSGGNLKKGLNGYPV